VSRSKLLLYELLGNATQEKSLTKYRTRKTSQDVDSVEFNVHGSVHRNNNQIYIQQDSTLHSLFYLESALHV
jgi:hypothetical protein